MILSASSKIKKSSEQGRSLQLDEESPGAAMRLPLGAAEPASQADVVLLKQIVFGMPPRLQEVFVLSRFVHLEYQEISERLGIPVTTVQWRMTKALEYCTAKLRL